MIISTTEELRLYAPSNAIDHFDTMAGFIDSSEHDFLEDKLGTPLYDSLQEYYNNNLLYNDQEQNILIDAVRKGEKLPPYLELLSICQRVVVYDALARAIDVQAISVNGAGVNVAVADDYNKADQAAITAYKLACIKEAHTALNRLLITLEKWTKESPTPPTPPTSPTSPTPTTPRTYKNGGTSFFDSFSYDPEIASLKAKMELEKQSLELAKATHASKQVIADQEKAMWDAQANYYDKLGDNLQSQIEEMTALTQPVQDFGTNIGEAFATMTTDAEAGRAAIKAAIGEMIKDFMKQTVQMAQEYIKRRIQQKMYDRLMSKQIKSSADEQKKIETDKGDAVTEAAEITGKDVLKATKSQAKQLLKTKEKSTKEETKEEESKQADLTDITKSSGEAREFLNEDVEKNIADATSQIGAETLATHQAQATTEVQTESAKTQANTVMGIASGASKIIGSLGWWGIPLIAVITALLNGLLSFAMSKVSSLFGGGGGDNADSGPNVKLVSGMLTYDSGNVQAFRGINDGKSYPVVGSDGKVYAATDGGELSTGLVKDPITTWVNGQPALVAEKGPEMVIGRETTAAMMMSRPDLLREIVAFDKHRSGTTMRPYATFDQGNLSEIATLSGTATVPRSFAAGQSPSSSDLATLSSVLTSLSDVLTSLQQKGIPASINMYGTGGLKDSMDKANAFLSRNRRN